MTSPSTPAEPSKGELREKIELLETFRFHPAGCHATYPEGMCDCYHKYDLDTIMQLFKSAIQELEDSLPTDDVVTTKYGYNSDEKKYGYRIAIAEAHQAIADFKGRVGL